VRSGLTRARFKDNPPRITNAGYTRALSEFAREWSDYVQLAMEASLIEEASNIAERHRLRAYDAVHLASALQVQIETSEEVQMATWDHDLAAAATAEGLSLAHEVTT